MAVSETTVGWGILLAAGSVTAAVIVNGAMGNYEDSKGQAYGAASNVASVSIAGVSAALVAPKEVKADPVGEAVARGTTATKTFTITNDSNISDAYVIDSIAANGGSVTGVAFAPANGAAVAATIGSTVSPTVAPGGTLGVTVTVATAGATVGSAIDVVLTIKTTAKSANGTQSASGNAFIWVAHGAQLSGTEGTVNSMPAVGASPLPVDELVDGASNVAAEPGSALSYELPFINVGDAGASGVSTQITLPAQLKPVAGTLSLHATDGRSGKPVGSIADAQMKVNGNIITVTIPRVDPDVAVALTWGAALTSSAAIGSTVHDTAIINAAYVPQVTATPAAVFVGAMNTVYDAIGGSAHPISGASVALVDAGGQPAKLSASDHGGNPFTTSQNGTFAFALPAASAHENDYQLDVSAAGYLNRRIKLALVTSGGTTTSTLSALDGLPLATAGGFGLTSGSVSVSDIPSFYGNVPMFAPQALIVTATTDRSVVSAGDRLGYSVTFGPGSKPLSDPGDLNLTLPAGFAYARGTARLDGAAVEPAVNGSNLAWSVKELTQNNTLTFDAVALPSVSTGATLTTQVQAKAVLPGASLTANASVSVSIVGGPLSSRSILTGRVFTDHGHDGHFVAGDTGVAGVRIYLEDGESVMTDRDGKFSFPAARPGMHVLHLDPITLPAGLRPYHGFPVNDPRSVMRLVHGIFDSGLMSDVNFAVDDARAH